MKRTAIIVTGGVIVSLAVYLQVRQMKSNLTAPGRGNPDGPVTSMVPVATNHSVTSLAPVATNHLGAEIASSTIGTEPPPRLRAVYGLSGETYAKRQQAIQSLTPPFTEEELKAAFDFLHYKGGSDASWDHVLKNEMMNLLKDQ